MSEAGGGSAACTKQKVRMDDASSGGGGGGGPFSHAVYRQISLANGRINRMTKQQMRDKLIELGLDPRCYS